MSSFWSKPIRNIIGSKASEAITSVVDKVVPQGVKDFVETAAVIYYGGKLPGDIGALLKSKGSQMTQNALIASVFGGDPKAAAMVTGIAGILPQLPGEVGKFFNTDAGKALMGMFVKQGGDFGAMNEWLGMLGMSGDAGNMIQQIAKLMALSAFSNKFAKDAINKAEEFEAQETEMVRNLATHAQRLSDPQYQEQTIGASLDKVGEEFDRARESTIRGLYARGLGDRTQGPVAALARDEAIARLQTRQGLEQSMPSPALQAEAAALGPMQTAADRARQTAQEQRMLPFNFVASSMQNREGPMDQYYKNLLAQQQAAAQQQQNNAVVQRLGPLLGNVVSGFKTGWPNMQTGNAGTVVMDEKPSYPFITDFASGWGGMNYNLNGGVKPSGMWTLYAR